MKNKESNYSALSVCAGSVEAALRAGISPASDDATASVRTDAASAVALTPFNSYNCDSTSRAHGSVARIPIASPIAVWLIAPRMTIAITPPRGAPRAIRMPISEVRRATV